MTKSKEQSPLPPLPEVEQAIAVCRDLGELAILNAMLDEGVLAGVVLRSDDYDDFEKDVLNPTMELGGLMLDEKREFDRKPTSVAPAGNIPTRELLHLDVEYPPQRSGKPNFRLTKTVGRITSGQALFAAAQSQRRVRAWPENKYNEERGRLNLMPVVKKLRLISDPSHWFNKSYTIEHGGVRGPLGVVYVGEGDVYIFPQGGGESVSPAWHSVITTLKNGRKSESYHLVPAVLDDQE